MPPPTPHQTLTTAHLTLQTLTSILTSTPASTPPPPQLLAELSHYKELFSQLRFSYLEQVTKEKFLRSIASDPPTIYDGDDNALLEADLRDAKESLKEKKREVQEVLDELEAVGGRLADGECAALLNPPPHGHADR